MHSGSGKAYRIVGNVFDDASLKAKRWVALAVAVHVSLHLPVYVRFPGASIYWPALTGVSSMWEKPMKIQTFTLPR
jgi:hypothetical protein